MQGRKPSESAALNIRLDKNHKARPFGEITGSLGVKPTIWDNQLFLTQVMKHSQTLVSAKMSNTGKDLSKETKEPLMSIISMHTSHFHRVFCKKI